MTCKKDGFTYHYIGIPNVSRLNSEHITYTQDIFVKQLIESGLWSKNCKNILHLCVGYMMPGSPLKVIRILILCCNNSVW